MTVTQHTDPRTIGHHIMRLNRLLRAKAGHPPPTRPPSRHRRPLAPHDLGELEDLARILVRSDRGAAAEIVARAGAGLTGGFG